jgi:hypothetical protein
MVGVIEGERLDARVLQPSHQLRLCLEAPNEVLFVCQLFAAGTQATVT